MKVTTKNEKILGHKTEALILGLFEKQKITGDLKNIDDDKQDLNANYIKVKEGKLTLRHEEGVSPNQLNNCLLIKTFNINLIILTYLMLNYG